MGRVQHAQPYFIVYNNNTVLRVQLNEPWMNLQFGITEVCLCCDKIVRTHTQQRLGRSYLFLESRHGSDTSITVCARSPSGCLLCHAAFVHLNCSHCSTCPQPTRAVGLLQPRFCCFCDLICKTSVTSFLSQIYTLLCRNLQLNCLCRGRHGGPTLLPIEWSKLP